MSCLNKEQRTKIIAALVEGNSLRATARICDVAFNTVLKLLPEIDAACMEFQDKTLRNAQRRFRQWRRCFEFTACSKSVSNIRADPEALEIQEISPR